MKIKFLLVLLLSICYSPVLYANSNMHISYQAPFIPLEVTVDEDGLDVSISKDIITPIGKFSIGYSTYKAEFEEGYTYVIIEDMNIRKEYIYKVKNRQTLKLLNKGTTGVEITKIEFA